MRIDIVVFDGLDELDALGPWEVLRSAQRGGADFQTQLVTRTPQPQVTASYGLRFGADATYTPAPICSSSPAAAGLPAVTSVSGARCSVESGCHC